MDITVINLGCSDSDVEVEETRSTRKRVTRSMSKRNTKRNKKQKKMEEITIDITKDESTIENAKKKKTVMLDDTLEITLDDDSDEEIEQCIKVVWGGDVNRFNLKPSDKIQSIYENLSKKYNRPIEHIKIRHGDNILSMYNTVESLKIRVTEFLEACAVKEKYDSCLEDGVDKIKIKCLLKASKRPLDFFLHPNQNFNCVLLQCATETGSPIERLILKFDGDKVSSSATPTSLDLEGDECFEVHIV